MLVKTIKVKKLGVVIAVCIAAALFIFLVVYGVAHAYSDDCVTLETDEQRQSFIKEMAGKLTQATLKPQLRKSLQSSETFTSSITISKSSRALTLKNTEEKK